VTIALSQFLSPSLGVDGKKLLHLRHNPNGGLVFGIEFDRIKKFASRKPHRGIRDEV
jgi:hypothetical protein